MRYIKGITSLLFAFIMFAAVTANAQGTVAPSQMQPLEKKILKRINSLPFYGVFDHITFKLEGGTVTLDGKVAAIRNRSDAEATVKRIDGVTQVVNNIEVLPLSGFDDDIRERALRTLVRDGGGLSRYLMEPSPAMRIIVKNGRLTLEGRVMTAADAQLAYVIARTIPNVFEVTNALNIEKPVN